MELIDARALVAGATGALGGAIIAEPAGRGARVALAGRAVRDASAALGGLDAVVIASGDPRRPATVVADALESGAELVRSGPDGTPVVERRAR